MKGIRIICDGSARTAKVLDIDGNDVTQALMIESIEIVIRPNEPVLARLTCFAGVDVTASAEISESPPEMTEG